MTPKEKAKELVNKFMFASIYFTDGENGAKKNAKQCALIAVDEILNIVNSIYDYDREVLYPYWEEVKQEIENL